MSIETVKSRIKFLEEEVQKSAQKHAEYIQGHNGLLGRLAEANDLLKMLSEPVTETLDIVIEAVSEACE